ncbi:hypothetical protein BDW02DRAFT_597499 [Decorospora gaudefroyi]|uniref:Uncharacterized protein n=1 Tax=Decorospora gaudefroyi TaxID=184978 RepID=A0A6A5KHQ0_9PLEO|nr:hypothetical protein BDW02DRAFT_597499 [Decorospora gaudefroyi]
MEDVNIVAPWVAEGSPSFESTDTQQSVPTSTSTVEASRPNDDTKDNKTPDEGEDEGIWHERVGTAPAPRRLPPQPSPPRIIARCAEPLERRPTLSAIPLANARPLMGAPPPTLASMLYQALMFFYEYLTSFFCEPAIIEYSDAEIKRRTKIAIAASKIAHPSSVQKLIRVAALVTNKGEEEDKDRARSMEITAKPKRIRQILNGAECYTTEEVYGKQIKRALRKLKE